MSEFYEGDYVRVTQDHDDVRAGTIWRLEYFIEEDYDHDEDDNIIETYPAQWGAVSADGMRGLELDADKIEKVTENIPFSVYATIDIEVTATVYASSEADAIAQATSDYSELINNFSEMSGRVTSAVINEI